MPFSLISEESPLNSAVVKGILVCYYKYFVSYDGTKTEKISDFSALTWLIIAGPVTYYASELGMSCIMSVYG